MSDVVLNTTTFARVYSAHEGGLRCCLARTAFGSPGTRITEGDNQTKQPQEISVLQLIVATTILHKAAGMRHVILSPLSTLALPETEPLGTAVRTSGQEIQSRGLGVSR